MIFFLLVDDLKHLTAVRSAQHTKFAEENGMSSFLMSAKNGDQVKQTFWKVAANLAGMNLLFGAIRKASLNTRCV